MKKITFLLFTFLAFQLGNAQTNVFYDDFESYTDFAITNVGAWTLTDVDLRPTYGFSGVTFPNSGDAKSFQVFNSTQTVPPLTPSATSNWAGYNSLKGMVCFAAVPEAGVVNNDWLITPQITLAASGNTLTFMYKGCDQGYSNEQFKVGISTTDTATSSFTVISANPVSVPANDITWKTYSLAIPPTYDGQAVYFSINCVSNDQFGFMVDDFSVDTTLGVDEFNVNNFKNFYDSNSNVLTLESAVSPFSQVVIYNLIGQQVLDQKLSRATETLDLSSFEDGVYIAKVMIEGQVQTVKFLKQ